MTTQLKHEDALIKTAIEVLKKRLNVPGVWLKDPEQAKMFLSLQLAEKEHEVFCVAFLNAQYGLIEFREMFNGTVNEVEVPIREIAKAALILNAKAVVLCHNHPSGNPWPGPSDVKLTKAIEDALGLFDIEVYDHIIIAGGLVMSFQEEGIL